MKQKLITARRLVSTFILMAAFVVTQFAGVQFAHAAIAGNIWTGTTGDGKFSTAGNWTSGVAPVAGGAIIFDDTNLSADTTVNNDLTGLSVSSLRFQGTGTKVYTITGSALTITSDIGIQGGGKGADIINLPILVGADGVFLSYPLGWGPSSSVDTQGHSLSLSNGAVGGSCYAVPELRGSGTVTIGSASSSFFLKATNTLLTGSVAINAGMVIIQNGSLGSVPNVTVSGTAILSIFMAADKQTLTTPLTLGGTGYLELQHSGSTCYGGGSDGITYTGTQTGAVTLNSDFSYSGGDNLDITGTYSANGHSFTTASGISGTLKLPGSSAQAAPVETNTYSDSQTSTDIAVSTNQTAILDGIRQNVFVYSGGILMGNGTAKTITIGANGIIAPGHSPGKLTASQTLTISGTYQAQLKDVTVGDYDQIVVSDPSRTTGNDVNIDTGAKLDTSLYTGYNINKGDQFMIIKNLQPASQKVNGIFSGLAEGAQFTISGITFSISYIGGDGNDVVLTALTTGKAPTAPNTGIASLKLANPIVLAGLGVVAAGILFTLARRRLNK